MENVLYLENILVLCKISQALTKASSSSNFSNQNSCDKHCEDSSWNGTFSSDFLSKNRHVTCNAFR